MGPKVDVAKQVKTALLKNPDPLKDGTACVEK